MNIERNDKALPLAPVLFAPRLPDAQRFYKADANKRVEDYRANHIWLAN